MQQHIDLVLQEFIQNGDMFTSVDVANEVKRRGTWIRNREVAEYLRRSVLATTGYSYNATVIDVSLPDGTIQQANLYHPQGSNPWQYTAKAQRAITPNEFDSMHTKQVASSAPLMLPAPPSPQVPQIQQAPKKNALTTLASAVRSFKWPPSKN